MEKHHILKPCRTGRKERKVDDTEGGRGVVEGGGICALGHKVGLSAGHNHYFHSPSESRGEKQSRSWRRLG